VSDSKALKSAIESINQTASPRDEKQQLIAAKCRALMVGYEAKWSGDPWETVSTEEMFHLPIVNPDSGATSRTWTHAGKKDGIIRYIPSGREYLLEHKTTSESISDLGGSYWRRLVIDSQVSGYMLAYWQDKKKLDGTVYDVIKKPGIRPRQITKALQNIMIQRGTYLDTDVPKSFRLLEKENIELYEIRLTQECLSNPNKFYQRRTIPRLDDEIVEFANELWDIGKTILSARKDKRHYRNSDACMNWGSPCEYISLCSGHDNPESDKWETQKKIHPELPLLEHAQSILTNSRIRCFQSCRRKHFYRYELGIKRHTEEEREALYMGSVIHEALRAWWDCYRKENHDDSNSKLSANEVVSQHVKT